ncbi:MAG: immunoglobulin domain-containing protein, partial [Oscillospiraceae bacterium]
MNVKKSLASWLSVVLSATCMMSSMPVSAATNVTPGSEVNWAFEQPYKTNVTQFHNVKSDPDLKKLTDGVFMGQYEYDDNIVGFKEPNGESAAFEIDLGVTKDVKRVVVSCFDNATYGINPAATTVFEYYDEASSAWKALETVQTTSPYTGNYDDGDGVGFGMVAIQSAKTFSGSKVRVSFSGNSSWVMIDEIEVIGGADPNKPFMPIFTKDLNPQKTLSAGEALSLAVEATKGDDGILSYQWYKDDAPIDGATQDTYTIDSAQGTDSGRYKVEAI